MTFAAKCFEALDVVRKANGGKVPPLLWLKTVDTLFAVETANKKKKRPSTLTDEEWLVSLEKEPCLAGVNIREQLAHAQFWCKNNSRQCTRRFFVNWINKADRTVTAPGGQKTVVSQDVYKEPEGWRACEKARRALGLSKESWSILTAKAWLDLDTIYRKNILRAL